MKPDLVFAEIGDRACPVDREHFQGFFPGSRITVITEGDCVGARDDPRWGWRMNDFHKVKGLLDAETDIAIAFDADMRICSKDVTNIQWLARSFGLCLPANPRRMVKVDNEVGADAQLAIVPETGLMHAVNCGVIALDKMNEEAVRCAEEFMAIMWTHPMRGPMAWVKAFRATGFFPCLLPAQWCVCADDVGIGNEIVLHVGHKKVKEHYAGIL